MLFVSRLFSYLFHPLFAPLLSVVLLFNLPLFLNYRYTEGYFLYVYVIVFMNCIAAPLLISLYLKRINFISSLRMPESKDRVIPFLISSFFYGFTYFLLGKIHFPSLYLKIFGAATLAVVILFLLSLIKMKLSAHLTALGGICGMLIVLSLKLGIDLSNWLILFVLISGIVGTARLKLSAHDHWELMLGFLLGFALQFLLLI